MLVLPTCKELPPSHSFASMVSRAAGHWVLPQILMLLLLLQSLNGPGFEIPVVRSCLTRSSHCGLNITKYKSSNAPDFRPRNEALQVRSHLSCELLISTRRPFKRKSYSALQTPLLRPSIRLPGMGSWTKQFVPVSSSIIRAQSSSTMLRRLGSIVASGWLLYISAVLPWSAQMCLNSDAPNVTNCLACLNFWQKDFVPGRGQAWINFNNCISWSQAFHLRKLGSLHLQLELDTSEKWNMLLQPSKPEIWNIKGCREKSWSPLPIAPHFFEEPFQPHHSPGLARRGFSWGHDLNPRSESHCLADLTGSN